MALPDTVYDDLVVSGVTNGVGTRTQVSGARLREGGRGDDGAGAEA